MAHSSHAGAERTAPAGGTRPPSPQQRTALPASLTQQLRGGPRLNPEPSAAPMETRPGQRKRPHSAQEARSPTLARELSGSAGGGTLSRPASWRARRGGEGSCPLSGQSDRDSAHTGRMAALKGTRAGPARSLWSGRLAIPPGCYQGAASHGAGRAPGPLHRAEGIGGVNAPPRSGSPGPVPPPRDHALLSAEYSDPANPGFPTSARSPRPFHVPPQLHNVSVMSGGAVSCGPDPDRLAALGELSGHLVD